MMKKQEDITVEEIFPQIETSKSYGIREQYRYIFKQQSKPLYCSVCHEMHTWNEVKLNGKQCNGYSLELIIPVFGSVSMVPTKESKKKLRNLINIVKPKKDDGIS
jgi:hypothetical protein